MTVRCYKKGKVSSVMLRIAVCDGEAKFRSRLRRQLIKLYGQTVRIAEYADVQVLINDFCGNSRREADVLIIAAEPDSFGGMKAAVEMKRCCPKMKIIFTAYRQSKITEIFQADPFYFLIKPINIRKLKAAIDKADRCVREEDRASFPVIFRGSIYRVKTQNILYFESDKRTVILHCIQEEWKVYCKLDDIEAQVPGYFLRCHQSYLVNMNAVKFIEPFCIELLQGIQIPVSRQKYLQSFQCFQEYMGQNKCNEEEGKENAII